mgnify:CR=1 FL=1
MNEELKELEFDTRDRDEVINLLKSRSISSAIRYLQQLKIREVK